MAKSEITVHVDAKNMDRVRLLIWELIVLCAEMRVGASPFAERLEDTLERFSGDQDEDRPE